LAGIAPHRGKSDLLGVSRQFFVRLLEAEKIPFHRVGTHHRVLFEDLVAYRQTRSRERRAKLDQMTDELVEADYTTDTLI
jgi:excisionase family DNA binding protein